jgi:hypothetical protein
MLAICSCGPRPVSVTIRIASTNSRRASGWCRQATAGIEAAAVLKLEVSVETEEVRRANGAIGTRDALGRVVEVGKRKIELPGYALPCFQSESSGYSDGSLLMMAATPMPRVCSFARVKADAVDDRLDVGTVVTDEHQQQAVRAAQRGEGMLENQRYRPVRSRRPASQSHKPGYSVP